MISHRNYLAVLSLLFAALFVALAIEPRYRHDWALENALVAAFAVGIAASHRRLVLSRVSYTLIFLFLCLHEVGAHYTYAEVPYDEWAVSLTGHSLNEAMGWERNHFDRLVHFLYGLLMAYPLRELFLRVADVRGFWGYFLPFDFMLSTSALYELIEWGAAELFGGELGAAYLGGFSITAIELATEATVPGLSDDEVTKVAGVPDSTVELIEFEVTSYKNLRALTIEWSPRQVAAGDNALIRQRFASDFQAGSGRSSHRPIVDDRLGRGPVPAGSLAAPPTAHRTRCCSCSMPRWGRTVSSRRASS